MNANVELSFDDQAMKASGIDDIDNVRKEVSGRRVLILGGGDLARKKMHWIALLKQLGVEVYLADIKKKPTALDSLTPYLKGFFLIDDGVEEAELVDIGRKERFDVLDISTWGDSHLAMALRFLDSANLIIDTKPVDTNLDFLRMINRYNNAKNPLFRRLCNRLLVHDHYGARWVLVEAAKHMLDYHARHGFVTEVQVYTIENRSVNQELERIDALREGICLDLMPHAVRILQTLMPTGATWETNKLKYKRVNLTLSLSGGAREANIGCVIPGQVETFAAASLRGVDVVDINGQFGRIERFPFHCLIVVGKGIAANPGNDKDVKGVHIKFQSGQSLEVDLESQRISTPDGQVILPPKDVLHRGINLPLIEITRMGMPSSLPTSLAQYFQPLEQAYNAAELIDQSRRLPWLGHAYPVGEACTHLINSVPHDWWGEIPWQLQNLPQIQIGDVPKQTLVIP